MNGRIREARRKATFWIAFLAAVFSGVPAVLAQISVIPVDCVRKVSLDSNKTYTLATLASNDWNMWASATVNFAGRVTTENGANTFSEVWILHTDLFRWGVNEDLPSAKGPYFNVKERESFWAKGGAEVRVHTANTATEVCLCTFPDASKVADEKCLKSVSAGSS